MTQQLLTKSSEKTQQHVECRETSPVSVQSLQGGLHPIAQLQRMLGNRRVAQLIQAKQLTPEGKILGLQRKLTVGAADDQYEQEADRVAHQVMSIPHTSIGNTKSLFTRAHPPKPPSTLPATTPRHWAPPSSLARAPAGEEEQRIQPEDQVQKSEDKKEEKSVMKKEAGISSSTINPSIESRINSSKGSGNPLPQNTQTFMKSKFGTDFKEVRVHTDTNAVQLSKELNAQAFTVGRDIYFNTGKYDLQSSQGKHLLAHELTHVVQQQSKHERVQKKGPIYEAAKQERELSETTVPKTFNYELVHNKLIAHTVSDSNADSIEKFITVMHGYYGTKPSQSIRNDIIQARKGLKTGERKDIDITIYLPASVQKFLLKQEEYYQAWRDYVKKKGEPPFNISADAVTEYYREGPQQPDEYGAACHNFVKMVITGAKDETKGGQGKSPYQSVLKEDSQDFAKELKDSLDGKGNFKEVAKGDVQIGDMAVFITKKKEVMKRVSTGIVHSAVVMNVTNKGIELMEKTNPLDISATRTVDEVLAHYKKDEVYVKFLRK
jgi:hypothetical protein